MYIVEILTQQYLMKKESNMSNKTKKPDFMHAKEGDECWMYGIGETGISSIGDNYVTVWDDENKKVVYIVHKEEEL